MKDKIWEYVVKGIMYFAILSVLKWIFGFEFAVTFGMAMYLSFNDVDNKNCDVEQRTTSLGS